MSVSIPFNGNNYNIPERGEVGWYDLTDYLVALSNAAVVGAFQSAVRIATTTPQTLQGNDAILCMNVASPSAVTLPAGTAGQFYGIYDISGAAATNPITITPTGIQLINGAANYVIRSNYGGILVQFNGTNWVIVAETGSFLRPPLRVLNNATNSSFVDAGITGANTYATAADLQSCSAQFTGSNTINFVVNISTGESIVCCTSFGSNRIGVISDINNIFLPSDAGTGFVITKNAASTTVTFKNRMGGSRAVEIKSLTTNLSSVTAWA